METNKTFEYVDSDYEGKDVKWQGTQVDTNAQIQDTGSGPAVVLRPWVIKIPPDVVDIPDKEEILEYYRPTIEASLWKDDLKQCDETRITWDAKRHSFKIYVPCLPTNLAGLMHDPLTIHEYAKSKQ